MVHFQLSIVVEIKGRQQKITNMSDAIKMIELKIVLPLRNLSPMIKH